MKGRGIVVYSGHVFLQDTSGDGGESRSRLLASEFAALYYYAEPENTLFLPTTCTGNINLIKQGGLPWGDQ
jgi:hypothetical protein